MSNMSLKKKIIIFLGSTVVLFFLIGLPVTFYQTNKLKKHILDSKTQQFKKLLDTLVNNKTDVWLTNSLQIAKNPMIIKGVETNNRELCLQAINNFDKTYKTFTNFKNVKIQIIDKNSRSFVKSWNPDSFGEDESHYESYKNVLNTGKPLVTFEESPKGLLLKGLFPIKSNMNSIIGLVNFSGGLNSIKRILKKDDNIDFLYLLSDKYLNIATSLKNKDKIGNYVVSQKDFDKDFLKYCKSKNILNTKKENFILDKQYFTTTMDIKNFANEKIGVFIIGQKSSIVLEQLDNYYNVIKTLFGGFFIFFIMIIIALTTLTNIEIINPITCINDKINKIAKGDFRESFSNKLKSEFNQLGNALNKMLNELSSKITQIFNNANTVEEMSFELASASEQALASTNQITKSTYETNAAVETISSAVTEIGANLQQLNTNIESMSDYFTEIQEATAEGSSTVQRSVSSMDKIKNSSEAISNIVNVITEIAEQTNLLALNAAIEAAKAGEFGKGFAVVAEEVRKLAERSATAAKEITELITESSKQVIQGSKDIINTGDVLTKIVDKVSKTNDLVNEIRIASSEQAKGIEEIVDNTDNVLGLATMNSAATEQVSAAISAVANKAKGLEKISNSLKNQFDNFKIKSSV